MRSNAAARAPGARPARSKSDSRNAGCAAEADAGPPPPRGRAEAYQKSWLRKYRSMAAAVSHARRPPGAPSTAPEASEAALVGGR